MKRWFHFSKKNNTGTLCGPKNRISGEVFAEGSAPWSKPSLEIPKVGFLGRCLPKAAPLGRNRAWIWAPRGPRGPKGPQGAPWGPMGPPWAPMGAQGAQGALFTGDFPIALCGLLGGAREGSLHWLVSVTIPLQLGSLLQCFLLRALTSEVGGSGLEAAAVCHTLHHRPVQPALTGHPPAGHVGQ